METAEKKRKGLLVGLVAALMCVSVLVTLAILSASSNTLTNTFTSQGIVAPQEPDPTPGQDPTTYDGFYLYESKLNLVKDATNGGYYQADTATLVSTTQAIAVAEGMESIPKDSFAVVNGLTGPAFLCVEVVKKNGFDQYLTFEPAAGWELVSGVKGANKGDVYQYKGTGTEGAIENDVKTTSIVKNAFLAVTTDGGADETYLNSIKQAAPSIELYGYLVAYDEEAGATTATVALQAAGFATASA